MIPEANGREVVRCVSVECRLRQFVTKNGRCRRCNVTLPTQFIMPKAENSPEQQSVSAWLGKLSFFLRAQAQAAGTSPLTLVKEKCGIHKCQTSRILAGNGSPTMLTLSKLAIGLELSLTELLLQLEG